jgi:hypothetical protein
MSETWTVEAPEQDADHREADEGFDGPGVALEIAPEARLRLIQAMSVRPDGFSSALSARRGRYQAICETAWNVITRRGAFKMPPDWRG